MLPQEMLGVLRHILCITENTKSLLIIIACQATGTLETISIG